MLGIIRVEDRSAVERYNRATIDCNSSSTTHAFVPGERRDTCDIRRIDGIGRVGEDGTTIGASAVLDEAGSVGGDRHDVSSVH